MLRTARGIERAWRPRAKTLEVLAASMSRTMAKQRILETDGGNPVRNVLATLQPRTSQLAKDFGFDRFH